MRIINGQYYEEFIIYYKFSRPDGTWGNGSILIEAQTEDEATKKARVTLTRDIGEPSLITITKLEKRGVSNE